MSSDTEKKLHRINECFPFLDSITPRRLHDYLTRTYILTGKYRSMPRYKLRRLYELISYFTEKKFYPGNFELNRAKKEFPGLVNSIIQGCTATAHILRIVYVEEGYVENHS